MVDQFRQRKNTQRTKLSRVKGLPKEKNIMRQPLRQKIRQNPIAAQRKAITFLQLGLLKEEKVKQLAQKNIESIAEKKQKYNVGDFTSILSQLKGMKKQGEYIPKQVEVYATEWAEKAHAKKLITEEEKQIILEKIEKLKQGN